MIGNSMKQAEKLLSYIKDFEVTDLVGFGEILGVQEEEDFIEYVTKITEAFLRENRIRRRQLLKLAKDIQVANAYMVPASEAETEESQGD